MAILAIVNNKLKMVITMNKLEINKLTQKNSLKDLDEIELQTIFGGNSRWNRFLYWLGERAGELFPCYCSTGINSSNYQDYVNPNDPLM